MHDSSLRRRLDFPVSQGHGQTHDDGDHPRGHDDQAAIVRVVPQRHRLNRVDHGQKAIQGHEDQSVDADISRGND